MSKLVDINVVVRNQYGDYMNITTPVSVTKDGMFTTTLPEIAVSKLREYGLELEKNRAGRDGFFAAKTLDDLRGGSRICRRGIKSRTCPGRVGD